MANHRQVGPSRQPEARASRLRRDARDVALKFSRELPTRQYSPWGQLGIDREAIKEEVLRMTDNAKKVPARSGRWAIMARTDPSYEWVQIESAITDAAADALLRELEDDGLRADYIEDAMEEPQDWGEDAPA